MKYNRCQNSIDPGEEKKHLGQKLCEEGTS